MVSVNLWAAKSTLSIKFHGEPLDLKALKSGGAIYLPLDFFSTSLSMAVVFNSEAPGRAGEVQLEVGANTVWLRIDSKEVIWGDQRINLALPPIKQGDSFWLPWEIAERSGLTATETGGCLAIEWAENYLLSINRLTHKGRPAYLLRTAGGFSFNSFLLKEPDRLVLDLNGVLPAEKFNCDAGATDIVKNIRIGRPDPQKTRVVFDLATLTGYKLVSSIEEPGNLLLVFNSALQEVGFVSNTKEPRVFIDTTYPVQYQTTLAFNPHRVILDLWDVTLQGPARTIPGGGEWIDRIRVSQFDPHTIRVVLDVKEPRGCVVAPARQKNNRLEIKLVQKLTDLQWKQEKTGGKLVIKSSGQIDEEIIRTADQLVLLLHYMGLSEELEAKKGELPLKVNTPDDSGSTVRIEVPIPDSFKHNLQFNADRSELRLTFQAAPLHRKLIVLDPGHGGVDAGAIGSQGAREKEINLAVALKLKKKLEEAGAHVIMTREDDRYVALYERAAIANRTGALLMVSIHSNYHPDSKVNGVEVFHHPEREDSALLGQKVFNGVMKKVDLKPLAVKTSKDLVVTRETQMAAILLEMGFLSNRQEESYMKTEDFQERMVEGIFLGISDYLQEMEENIE